MKIIRPIFSVFVLTLFIIILCTSLKAQNKNESGNDKDIEAYVEQLAKKCWNLREKQTDSALLIGLTALEIAKRNNINSQIPTITGYIGVIYIHYLHDIKKSIPYFQESMKGSIENGDSIRIGYSYNNLGDAFMLTGNIPLALQYSQKSLDIFKRLKHPIGIAYGYINLGLIYRLEKKYDFAISNFEKAVSIRSSINDSLGYASALLELAKTYQEKGNINLAMKYYENSYENHIRINNISYTAKSLNGMAKIYYARKQYDKSYENFIKAIDLNKQKRNYYDLVEDYLGLALVYAQRGEIADGENILNEALKLSTELGLTSSMLATYETYAKLYEINNDYIKVSRSLNNFLVIYDSVLSLQQYEILNEIQNNFEIQNNLNEAENELAIRKQEQLYLIIIIGLMIILIILIIWRLRTQSNLNKKLSEANQTKDKLFSVISHDLRSPFNSILGFSSLILDEFKENETLTTYSNAIKQTSVVTLQLLNNLLTWARSQTGRIEFNPGIMQIDNLFSELEIFFKDEITSHKINIIIKNQVDHKIKADHTILRIIMTNLISNSIKYTKMGGMITLEATTSENKIRFILSDDGVGISEENLKKINHKKLNLISTPGIRNEQGTGLGLAICYDLIKVHNGTITVESKVNSGTKFTIEVPLLDLI